MTTKYKRVLLKLSGEALMGDQAFGIDPQIVLRIASEIREIHNLGVEVAIVIGGGNIFRGIKASEEEKFDRVTADHMGMLATVINSLSLQHFLEKRGLFTRVLSAIQMDQVCEPWIRRRAVRHLEKGRIVVMAAGTGNPYFTTDTAAVLRAIEVGADVVLKGTKVNGVYSGDPKKQPGATFFPRIGYMDILNQDLKVMDSTAISLCRDNRLPLIVFNIGVRGNLVKIVNGEPVGTVVGE